MVGMVEKGKGAAQNQEGEDEAGKKIGMLTPYLHDASW
jgi:hypothetical protein